MIAALLAALLLDAAFGEPRLLWDRLPHPAVLMGRLIAAADRRFNTGPHRLWAGAAVWLALALGATVLGLVLAALPGQVAEIAVAAILLAQRSLSDHVRAVARALRLSTGEGRRSVAMIVSRDTAAMDDSAVARAAIESAAENLSDGVIAPAFWFLVAGLPGLLVYKITNTADSMIGYRTPRYEAFGKVSARADDLLNLIPARLTALMFWLCRPDPAALAPIRAEARRHKSPNAGWPEAALSRTLGIALAGPRSYHGTTTDFPYVNAQGRRALTADDIDAADTHLWRVWRGVAAALALAWLATLPF
jgi:adenosylcobinamide-phosphate synthase